MLPLTKQLTNLAGNLWCVHAHSPPHPTPIPPPPFVYPRLADSQPIRSNRSHTLLGARAERNEYLLLHEFHNRKYICPDRAPFKKAVPVVPDDDDGLSCRAPTWPQTWPARASR